MGQGKLMAAVDSRKLRSKNVRSKLRNRLKFGVFLQVPASFVFLVT